MKFKITQKLMVLGILLVLIPSLLIGFVGYNAAEKAVYEGVNDRLMDQAKDWKLLVEAYDKEIEMQEGRVEKSAHNIVTAQTKATYDLIHHFIYNGEVDFSEKREELLDILSDDTVGESGYVWILDYEGDYVLSKDRLRDGESIWEVKDSDGNYVIQDLVSIGKELRGDEIGYHSYPWLNNGETESRDKIAAILHFPELEWVVGISTYYDDLVDTNYRERTIEDLKDKIAKQLIGRSGYIWVLDSEGNYIVSKNRLRDGENIWDAKDSDGNMVIQDLVRIGKSAEQTYHAYPWINTGETEARMKVAGMAYFEKWDWLIGVSAYYDDFEEEGSLAYVRNNILLFGFISIIIGLLAAFLVGFKISEPVKRLTATANKLNEGNLDVTVDVVSNDEIGDLAGSMEGLVMGFKMLKQQKEECEHKGKKKK
ncbi:hypothetical protein C0585_01600 [Candidatus Woesearchaeota archaeon]|nr:MAG: hypothetical protein C0585_01600 [Candidatus Woesearchaeota archaeon]